MAHVEKTTIEDNPNSSFNHFNSIDNFIFKYRIEGYLQTAYNNFDSSKVIDVEGVKVQHPALTLHAKAGYVLEEMCYVATTKKYQQRRNNRINKHFIDVKSCMQEIPQFFKKHLSPEIITLKNVYMESLIYYYMESSNNFFILNEK